MFKKWIKKPVLQKHSGTIRNMLASMTEDELAEAQGCLDELQRMLECEQTNRFMAVH